MINPRNPFSAYIHNFKFSTSFITHASPLHWCMIADHGCQILLKPVILKRNVQYSSNLIHPGLIVRCLLLIIYYLFFRIGNLYGRIPHPGQLSE